MATGDHREMSHDPDQKEIKNLAEQGIEKVKWAFPIESEQTLDGEAIDAQIHWIRFTKPEGAEFSDIADIEGKLYLPKKPNDELILFTPGFPGGNAGRFEQRYAKTFVDNGFAFFTVRHNGTSLTNGETTMEILNSAKRMELARAQGQDFIGGTRAEGYSPADIVNESITPLMALQSKFKKIHLMGQSMGVAASYNTLRRMADHPEVLDKMGNVVGIAGYVGRAEGEREGTWDGMKMPIDDLTDYEMGYVGRVKANMVPKERFQDEMWRVAEMNSKMTVPEHIGNVLVFTPEDPLIEGPNKSKPADEGVWDYGPQSARKLIIRDESALGHEKAHSMLWIKPENLLRAVEAKVSGHGPHYIKVPNTKDGSLEKG